MHWLMGAAFVAGVLVFACWLTLHWFFKGLK
jgi:hypothetical protein